MAYPRLNDAKRKEIEELLDEGNHTQIYIAKKCGVGVGTVSNIKKGFIKSPKDQPDPTNANILKLEAQNLALKDENQRCTRAYKAAQRQNSVFEALVDEMQQIVQPISPLPSVIKVNRSKTAIKEALVAHLTDEHADAIVEPHQVGGLERYNFPIALRRAEKFVDTIIKFSQQTLNHYKFDTLWILAHGDHTGGEIHKSVDHSYYRNQFRNTLAIGQMHALMLRDLAPYFVDVKILYVPGNHGRRGPKKDYHGAWDNWDYLVAETARMHCKDIENVEFMIPDAFSIGVEIEGWGFHITHGDEIRSWNSIPWYGIERKTRRLAALSTLQQRRVHYFCFGHFHNVATQAALDGETIINGAWVATDPWAFEKLSVCTEPSQWLHGVHREYGVTWRLNMKLKTDREHLGPNRYSVQLATEM